LMAFHVKDCSYGNDNNKQAYQANQIFFSGNGHLQVSQD
jgi:hypothetical protein